MSTSVEEFWKSFDLVKAVQNHSKGSRKFIYLFGAVFGTAAIATFLTRFFRRKSLTNSFYDDRKNADGCTCQCHTVARPRSVALTDSGNNNAMVRSMSGVRGHQSVSISSDAQSVIPGPSSPVEQTDRDYLHIAFRYLSDAMTNWERAVRFGKLHKVEEVEMLNQLEKTIERAQELHDVFERFLTDHCPDFDEMMSVTKTLTQDDLVGRLGVGGLPQSASINFGARRTMSILSDDSFMSAFEDLVPTFSDVDVMLRESLKLPMSELLIYQDALTYLKVSEIPVRNIRSTALNCSSDEEFLAKLHCVRKAFQTLLMEEKNRDWMIQQGRSIIGDLMKAAKKDAAGFYSAYDKLIDYVQDHSQWPEIEEELRKRKVPMLSFYDVVLDFILMDAFDDLARPPSTVVVVAQNRFLSASFKESTLATVVWSVLKAKRARLTNSDGFVAHFYDVSEQVSPTMAWGFLGTDERLRDLCYYFKEQVCCALSDMFSFERVRFTNLEDLSDDIWHIIKYRAEMTQNRICSETM